MIKKYKTMYVKTGDSVAFKYSSNHDVHWHPSGTCARKGSKLIGNTKQGDGKRAKYIFSKAGKYTFVCQKYDHCARGQIVTIVANKAGKEPKLIKCCKNGMTSGQNPKCAQSSRPCSRMYKPVCGCDGKTYANSGCAANNVQSSKNGKCQ